MTENETTTPEEIPEAPYVLGLIYRCPHCGKLCIEGNPPAVAQALQGQRFDAPLPCSCADTVVLTPDPEPLVVAP